MKASNFLQYAATSSDTAVTVISTSTASAGSHTVAVSQLATKSTLTSSASVSKEVQGSSVADYDSLTGESFVMTLDGTDYTVDLDAVTDVDTLQTAIDTAVDSGKVTVGTTGTALEFTATAATTTTTGTTTTTTTTGGVQVITVSATSTSNSGLTDLGFGTDAILSNRLDTFMNCHCEQSEAISYVTEIASLCSQ